MKGTGFAKFLSVLLIALLMISMLPINALADDTQGTGDGKTLAATATPSPEPTATPASSGTPTLSGTPDGTPALSGTPDGTPALSGTPAPSEEPGTGEEPSEADVQLFAVTFVDWDGTEIGEAQAVKAGGDAVVPADPVREGYLFTGWDPAGTTNIQADTVFTAQYAEDTGLDEGLLDIGAGFFASAFGAALMEPMAVTTTYSIQYVRGCGDNGQPKKTVTYNSSSITAPSLSDLGFGSVSGFEFLGWSTESSPSKRNTVQYAVGAALPADNYTLYGVWRKVSGVTTYPVTYSYTGDIPEGAPDLPATEYYERYETVTVVDEPTLSGYVFNGWEMSTSGVWVIGGRFTMPGKAVHIEGSWTRVHTITTSVTNGTITPTATVQHGEDKTISYSTSYGYHLVSVIIDGTTDVKATNPNSYRFNDVAADHTITVTYAPNQYSLTIYYVYLGGTAAPTYQAEWDYGATYNVTSPTKPNYKPNEATVSGEMPAYDVTVFVWYARNDYELTIEYKYENGTKAADSYSAWLDQGDPYNVTSPTITGYTADRLTVAGNMPRKDKTETVVYKKNKYDLTINYVNKDGVVVAPQYKQPFDYNAPYSVSSPTITGYTADRLTVAGNMPAENKTVTVTYTGNPYTLTINYVYAGGGTAAGTVTRTVKYGDPYSETSPTITGYTADQLTVSGNMPAENKTVNVTYTINKYTITTSVNGGGGTITPTDSAVPYGSDKTIDYPANAGYRLKSVTVDGGLLDTSTGNKTSYTFSNVTENHSIAVEFESDEYTVTYLYDGLVPAGAPGLPAQTKRITGDAVAVSTPPPTLTGYAFGGWTTTDATITGGSFTMPAKNVTIKGSWTRLSYTITSSAANGTITPAGSTTVWYGENQTFTYSPNARYRLKSVTVDGGLLDTSTDNRTGYTFSNVTENHSIAVEYEPDAYKVTYSYENTAPAGASALPTQPESIVGDSVAVAALPTVPAGYTFSGWKSDDVTIAGDGSFTMPAKNVTIKGSWTAIKYQVTYSYAGTVPAGAPALPGAEEHIIGDTVTVPAPLTLDGYMFGGWASDDVTIASDGSFTMPAGNVEINGEWSEIPGRVAHITLRDSHGAGLAGGVVSYYAGGWVENAATTGADGKAVLVMPEGKSATSVAIAYKGGRVQLDQSMSVNPVYEFQTVPVTVKLLDSKGAELTGTVSYYGAGSWLSFGAANTTMELLPGGYTFAASYKGGYQEKTVTVSGATEVVFATKAFAFRLIDSKGAPLTGTASFYAGSWQPFGDDGAGSANTTMELLPVEYTFAAVYNGGYQEKRVNAASEDEVVFQTGEVNIHFAGGTLTYYTSTWLTYTGPVELLPVETNFYFNGGGFPERKQPITPVAGQSLEYTVAYVKLLSSGGAGLAGGNAQYNDGGWRDLGTTGANGTYFGLLTGNKAKSMGFGMTLGGTTAKKTQDLSVSSFIVFQSVGVEVRLIDSKGNPLAGTAQYYTSGWRNFTGTTPITAELMPGEYNFGVNYKGATNEKRQDISVDPVVVFHTVPVTVKLISSTGAELSANASYYTGGWRSLGETSQEVEILPGSYRFEVAYLGARVEKTQDISAAENRTVIFNTVKVSFDLLDGLTPLEAAASFYTNGWRSFGSGKTGSTMEMLPTSYKFKAIYQTVSYEKTQNVGDDSRVIIQFWTKRPTSTTVTAAPASGVPGSALTISGTVADTTGALGTPTFSGDVEIKLDGTTHTVSVAGDGTFTLSTVRPAHAGDYTVTANYKGADSFEASSGSTTVAVDKWTVTITAANASKYAGAPDPAFTASVTVGAIHKSNGTDYDFTYDVTRIGSDAAAGTYTGVLVVVPDTTAAGYKDYDVTLMPGNFTINKRPTSTTVTATPTSGIPGSALTISGTVTDTSLAPAYPAGITGFVSIAFDGSTYAVPVAPDGTFTLAAVTARPAHAGNYTVTANYLGDETAFATSSGTAAVTVVGRPITITANDASKYAGAPDPAFTANVTGTYYGDFSYRVDRSNSGVEAAATYADVLEVVPDIADPEYKDYVVTLVPGDFTINLRPTSTTVTATPASGIPGSALTISGSIADMSGAAAYSGGFTGSVTITFNSHTYTVPVAANGTFTLAAVTTRPMHAGSRTVTVSYPGDAVFAASDDTTTVTVTAAPAGTATLTIRFLLQGAGTQLADPYTETFDIGDAYSVADLTEKLITGYTRVSVAGATSGTITDDVTITVYYNAAATLASTPAPTATPTPTPTATPVTVNNPRTPLAGPERSWALTDLILALLMAVWSAYVPLRYFGKRRGRGAAMKSIAGIGKQDMIRLLSLIPGIGGVITFILTQDVLNPMVLAGRWTPLMVALFLIQAGMAALALRGHSGEPGNA